MKLYFRSLLNPLTAILVLQVLLLINTRFTLWPEIVSFPYLVNKGFLMYSDFVHPYPPLLTLVLAVFFTLFGYNFVLLKIFVWILIISSSIFIFKIGKILKIENKYIYPVLTGYVFLQVFLEGNMIWFDTALTFPLLLLVWASFSKRWKTASIALLCMCLVKQSAVFVYAVYVVYLIATKKWKVLSNTVATHFVFVSLVSLVLWRLGALKDAFNWVIYYPSKFWTKFPGYLDLDLTRSELVILTSLTLPAVFLLYKRKHIYLSFLYFASVVAVYPRFSFFHLQPAIALFSLCIMLSLKYLPKKFVGIALLLYLFVVVYSVRPFISWNWGASTRFFEASDQVLFDKVKHVVAKDTNVYLLNLPSSVYVMTDTYPPTPWFDNYGWYFEVPGIQQEVISRWKDNSPESIIWQERLNGAWYEPGSYEPEEIVSWIRTNYERRVEISPGTWYWKKL